MKEDSFENKMTRLDEIVEGMQTGEVSLQESVKLFEEGVSIISSLNAELSGVKKRIKILIEKSDDPKFAVFGEQDDD